MLKGLAKIKVVKELRELHQSKSNLKGLALIKCLRRMIELRQMLSMGVVKSEVVKPTLDADDIERLSQIPIDDTKDMGQGGRKGVAKKWLQDNLVGKTVRTVDGKIVHFNSADTVNHIPYNVRRNAITVMCVPHIPMIFAKGEFVGRETPNHGRVDETIQAFHLYRKWVELKNGYKVYAEVQACERENKADLFYAGYNLKTLEKKKAVFDGLPYHELHHADTVLSNTILLSKETNNPSKTAYAMYDKAIIDEMQVDIDVEQTLPLRILQVLDKHGVDITDEVLS